MYQSNPLHARCERLRDAAIATACEPAVEESGLRGLFRLWNLTAMEDALTDRLWHRLIGSGEVPQPE